jgi:hypothetical protein
MTISSADFLEMLSCVEKRGELDAELWPAIIDHYRNYRTFDNDESELKARREIARKALEKFNIERRFAYIDWQKVDDDDETPAVSLLFDRTP